MLSDESAFLPEVLGWGNWWRKSQVSQSSYSSMPVLSILLLFVQYYFTDKENLSFYEYAPLTAMESGFYSQKS